MVQSETRLLILSTTEAEFVAGGEAAKEATWIRAFPKEIGRRNLEAIPYFCDNQGAIRVANNPELHRRMKHVELVVLYNRHKRLE